MSKDIPFEKLCIGEKFGPDDVDTSEKAIRRYCEEMGDMNPLYLEESPWGKPVIPPMYLATLLGLRMIGTKYDSHATVPTRLVQKNLNTAFVGSKLFLSGTLIDKYMRKGMEYAVIESVLTDENGTEIRRVIDHFLLSLERRQ